MAWYLEKEQFFKQKLDFLGLKMIFKMTAICLTKKASQTRRSGLCCWGSANLRALKEIAKEQMLIELPLKSNNTLLDPEK